MGRRELLKRTVSATMLLLVLASSLTYALNVHSVGYGASSDAYGHLMTVHPLDGPDRVIDLHGGADNEGHGPGYPGPFPAPYGGQGKDQWMDVVFPRSEVRLHALVAYNYWPVQSKQVGFRIEGPYEKLANGTLEKKEAWQVWGEFTAYTGSDGIATVTYRMPWPTVNPESLMGVWKTNATATVADVAITDMMFFYYENPVYMIGVTTDKYHYSYLEYVRTTVNYQTRAAQQYPAVFSVVLKNESGAQFASTLVSNPIGGATNETLKTSTLNVSTLIPFVPGITGVAFVYVNCYDKDPATGGFAWCPEYAPPPEIALQHLTVPDDYSTIQEAINNASAGFAIFVRSGIYFENVIVNKSVSLIGENRQTTIIDGSVMGDVVKVTADNVITMNFTIRNSGSGGFGILIDHRSHVRVQNDNVENNVYGVGLWASSSDTITENNVIANSLNGIDLVDSSSNTITKNNITGNQADGMHLVGSSDNHVFHNNFRNNAHQVSSATPINAWDEGYPSGGNFWSDYAGVDTKKGPYQNETGNDGIGDTPYIIDSQNQDAYPLFYPWPSPNIALTAVWRDRCLIGKGYPVRINVTIENKGRQTESFNVTIYANTTIAVTENVALNGGDSSKMTFTWNTAGFAYGNYHITIFVWPIPNEINTTDNTLYGGKVLVTIPGDVNGDRKVDLKDIYAVGKRFGWPIIIQWYSPEIWPPPPDDPNLDINCDGRIDLRDYFIVCKSFGQSW
jgi:parallel beta-helix repeat protein